jgi:hypothetical protein
VHQTTCRWPEDCARASIYCEFLIMMPNRSATKAQNSRLVRTAIASLLAIHFYFLIRGDYKTKIDTPLDCLPAKYPVDNGQRKTYPAP